MRSLKHAFFTVLLGFVLGLGSCSKPDPALVHRAKGNEHYNKAEWAEALKEYDLSLRANPRETKVWLLKANAHLYLGQLKEAADALTKPAEYTTDSKAIAEMYRNAANMFLERKKVEDAEKYFLQALQYDPADELSLAWLGEIASTRGGARLRNAPVNPVYLDQAIEYYNRAIAVNPKYLFSYVNKRIALLKYTAYENSRKEFAQKDLVVHRKNAAIVANARRQAAESDARIEQFKAEIDELGKKISELQKAAKEAKQAPQALNKS